MSLPAGVLRAFAAASLLAVLAACSTLPADRIAAPARPGEETVSTQSGRNAQAPACVAAAPDDGRLLGGEVLRALEQGQASWYGQRFHGRRTASGERYNMHAFTAAHKTLPFGALVRVRSLVTGREVDVRITDRGPFSRGRVIDLSRAAAEQLGMLSLGVKEVQLLVPASEGGALPGCG